VIMGEGTGFRVASFCSTPSLQTRTYRCMHTAQLSHCIPAFHKLQKHHRSGLPSDIAFAPPRLYPSPWPITLLILLFSACHEPGSTQQVQSPSTAAQRPDPHPHTTQQQPTNNLHACLFAEKKPPGPPRYLALVAPGPSRLRPMTQPMHIGKHPSPPQTPRPAGPTGDWPWATVLPRISSE
jgi:hypothetical protein